MFDISFIALLLL